MRYADIVLNLLLIAYLNTLEVSSSKQYFRGSLTICILIRYSNIPG